MALDVHPFSAVAGEQDQLISSARIA
ncbi:uncharacterized protein METZ01_LOCUS203340 [marine metagenome]|uniref:Uncharacterized protein n=1 Tax=marine metagenome TaxID=408172 RepID=A0A382EI74_9ZZZZ